MIFIVLILLLCALVSGYLLFTGSASGRVVDVIFAASLFLCVGLLIATVSRKLLAQLFRSDERNGPRKGAE